MTNPESEEDTMATAEMPNETHDWTKERERLRKQADEGFPPPWQPEQPDDEVMGVVRKITMQAPTSYGPAPVVELVQENGERISVWLFHKVLRMSFIRERVALGELVLVRYLGRVKPDGGGNAYDNYRLVVLREHGSGEADWAAMAERYGDMLDPDEGGKASTPAPADDAGDTEDIPF